MREDYFKPVDFTFKPRFRMGLCHERKYDLVACNEKKMRTNVNMKSDFFAIHFQRGCWVKSFTATNLFWYKF